VRGISQTALRMRGAPQPQLIWPSLWHGFNRNWDGSNRATKLPQRRGVSNSQREMPKAEPAKDSDSRESDGTWGVSQPALTWSSLWLGSTNSGEKVHPSTDPRHSQVASTLRCNLATAVKASKAPAISRAVAVLRLLGSTTESWGMQAIARELGMVPSTCHYVLRALLAEELISFDPITKRYAPEVGVFVPSRLRVRCNRFADLAQPLMDRISQGFGVTVGGLHIVGQQGIAVAVSRANAHQFNMLIGDRFPPQFDATGQCIAAFSSYSEAALSVPHSNLLPKPDEWRAQIRETRAQGFAVDHGRCMPGLTVIGVPIWTGSKVSHLLLAIGRSNALTRDVLCRLQIACITAAQTLTESLRREAEKDSEPLRLEL